MPDRCQSPSLTSALWSGSSFTSVAFTIFVPGPASWLTRHTLAILSSPPVRRWSTLSIWASLAKLVTCMSEPNSDRHLNSGSIESPSSLNFRSIQLNPSAHAHTPPWTFKKSSAMAASAPVSSVAMVSSVRSRFVGFWIAT